MARTPPLQPAIPIQPVERPILCSPYKEPDQHWKYDTVTGAARKEPGRRPASYWYKTERTGSAQMSLLTQEQQDDLPLPNLLREDVRRWRDADYRGATLATRELLRHWAREDRERRLFFGQREAVETLIYLAELRFTGRTSRLRFTPKLSDDDLARLLAGARPGPAFGLAPSATFFPTLVDKPSDPALLPLRRLCTKLATGSGKTIVAAMLIAWAFVNRGINPESWEYPDVALVCAPNLTVKERLGVLRPEVPDNYYDAFDLVPAKWRPLLQRGTVIVENWHRFAPESPHKDGDKTFAVVDKGEETPADLAHRILGTQAADRLPILVINDEGHHCWRRNGGAETPAQLTGEEQDELREATVWVEGLDWLNAAGGASPGVQMVVDLSATPFRIKGSNYPEGEPFAWIVSDFGLVDAIESGITKIPRLPVQDTTGRPDPKYFRLWESIRDNLQPGERLPGRAGKPKPSVIWREAEGALVQIMGQWKERFARIRAAQPGVDRTPPCLIIVCDNTDIAEEFFRRVSGERVVEAVTEADVQDVLDEDETEDEAPTARRGKKPKPRIVYGPGEVFPDLFSNTQERKYTIRIDSKLLAQAESGDTGKKKADAAEELRRVVATVGKAGEPGEHVRCVVSVAMLTEGWDANTVTQILGLRAFTSQLLCEQVVGRGLRRMDYRPDPDTGLLTEEYCDVYGVPFSVIPFRGRPVDKPEPDDAPLNLVRALPERAAMEMRFPVVEGYAFALRHNLIRCDVGAMERLSIEPNREPTGTFVRPQVGVQTGGMAETQSPFGFTQQDRQAYYDSVHLQTILFQAAQRVVEELTQVSTATQGGTRRHVFALQSRHALFPQVFRVVEEYVRRKVDFRGAHKAELGLEKYLRQVVERVRDAIQPDDAAGEPPLLPLLNRTQEIGSTAGVEFRTKRPVFATIASHIGHVVADTEAWEQSAAFRVEQAAQKGIVRCYARNVGLDLSIPYEFLGVDHGYEPDFLVRLVIGEGHPDLILVLEIKGQEDNRTAAKHEGAHRWVRAVNNWGKLGQWAFHVCRDPQMLERELVAIARQAGSAVAA
jgi:type III restriction enzyme